MRLDNDFVTEEWLNKIGEYDVALPSSTDPKGQTVLNAKTLASAVAERLGPEGHAALYKGCPEKEIRTARENFELHLQKVVNSEKKWKLNPDKTINLKEFLGENGIELYKAAVEEEKMSKEFRDAIFASSLNFYLGKKAAPPMDVTIIAGASSTGKSFGTKNLQEDMIKKQMQKGEKIEGGSEVLSIDGGNIRDCSQMMNLVIQAALSIGSVGIKDVHTHTKFSATKNEDGNIISPGIKDILQNTALASKLHMVVPLTFADPSEFKIMQKYLDMRKSDPKEVDVNFANLEGDSKVHVGLMGRFRAWLIGINKYFQAPQNIKPNNHKIGCSSKDYEGEHYVSGKTMSAVAEAIFTKETGKDAVHITNALIFVKKNEKNIWVECDKKDWNALSPDFVKISRRDFDTWSNLENSKKSSLFVSTSESEDEIFGPKKDPRYMPKLLECKKANTLGEWSKFCLDNNFSSPPTIKYIGEKVSLKRMIKLGLAALHNEVTGWLAKKPGALLENIQKELAKIMPKKPKKEKNTEEPKTTKNSKDAVIELQKEHSHPQTLTTQKVVPSQAQQPQKTVTTTEKTEPKTLEFKVMVKKDTRPTNYPTSHRLNDDEQKRLEGIIKKHAAEGWELEHGWERETNKDDISRVYRRTTNTEQKELLAKLDHSSITMPRPQGQSDEDLAKLAVELAKTYESKTFSLESDMLPSTRKVFVEIFAKAGLTILENTQVNPAEKEQKSETHHLDC
jgi:hypothetical protein